MTALSIMRNLFSPETNAVLGTWWVVVGVSATAYSFFWDVVMDWGLGDWRSNHFLLRDELHFHPYVYYSSIVADLLMRLGWAFVISPDQPYLQQNYLFLLAVVELNRRFMWTIFRVEWEYIRNSRSRDHAKYEKANERSLLVDQRDSNFQVEITAVEPVLDF